MNHTIEVCILKTTNIFKFVKEYFVIKVKDLKIKYYRKCSINVPIRILHVDLEYLYAYTV